MKTKQVYHVFAMLPDYATSGWPNDAVRVTTQAHINPMAASELVRDRMFHHYELHDPSDVQILATTTAGTIHLPKGGAQEWRIMEE